MDQRQLSDIFIEAEKHRLDGSPPVAGWGSNKHGDKDSLWDCENDIWWERDHPNGAWYKVPGIGGEEIA